MSEFMFLYRGGVRSGSPEEMEQGMRRWMTWMKDLSEKGHIKIIGSPLESGGKTVQTQAVVTDGPYAEKDLVCGFTIVEAADLAHAAELTAGCPIFEAGGLVEVRPVIAM